MTLNDYPSDAPENADEKREYLAELARAERELEKKTLTTARKFWDAPACEGCLKTWKNVNCLGCSRNT